MKLAASPMRDNKLLTLGAIYFQEKRLLHEARNVTSKVDSLHPSPLQARRQENFVCSYARRLYCLGDVVEFANFPSHTRCALGIYKPIVKLSRFLVTAYRKTMLRQTQMVRQYSCRLLHFRPRDPRGLGTA